MRDADGQGRVATSAVGRLRRVTTAKQMATSRPVRMMVQAGLMEEVSVLSAGEPIFVGTVENERNEDHLGDEGRRGPHEKLGGTGGEAQGEQHAHQDNRLDRVPLDGGTGWSLRRPPWWRSRSRKTAQDID